MRAIPVDISCEVSMSSTSRYFIVAETMRPGLLEVSVHCQQRWVLRTRELDWWFHYCCYTREFAYEILLAKSCWRDGFYHRNCKITMCASEDSTINLRLSLQITYSYDRSTAGFSCILVYEGLWHFSKTYSLATPDSCLSEDAVVFDMVCQQYLIVKEL